jgi:diguanylate cyclase (GGDEF)-like protein
MKYASFERLVLVLGGASVLATIALTSGSELFVQEVIAQLMLFGVLFCAVHWGRRGGFVAAIAASLAYIAMRIPLLPADTGPTTDTVVMILTRVLAYGLVGIVGGELATRMKYVLAGLEGSSNIDPLSGIYNQSTFARLLESAMARFERYGEPFSVVVIGLESGETDQERPNKQRALVRTVASAIRNDIRLVDEAGRLADGEFAVLLPHTLKNGGDVVSERLAGGVRATVGARANAIATRCFAAAEDAQALRDLLARIGEAPEGATGAQSLS